MEPGFLTIRQIAVRWAHALVVVLIVLGLPTAVVWGQGQRESNYPARVQWTLVDEPVIHYATFQSHNQKVVSHEGRVYMTHVRTRNEAYTEQAWRLSVSDDAGRSFRTLLEEAAATNPPILEIDSQGNLYLIRVDFNSGDAFLDRWNNGPGDIAGQRKTTRIPGGAAGKYSAIIDPKRQMLYFFSHNNTFHRIRLDGTLVDSRSLLREGTNGVLQYPHLSLGPDGELHLAWTTQKHGEYLYWDIHHMVSTDGGDTFETWNANGPRETLTLPVVADDTGPTSQLILDDEFESHTWLSSILATNDHVHVLYLAQLTPWRQHYQRYDRRTGLRQIDRFPKLAGDKIRLEGLDGFFVADPKHANRLFVVGSDHGKLGCLVSHDAGETWQDYALSQETMSLYAIGGCRWTVDDGAIIGTVTNQTPPESPTDAKSSVYFFRIQP